VARILIIDEDAPLRGNLRRLLELEGHEVVEADGGRRGLALALADLPDAVLCDLMMPDLDGAAVLDCLRADPRTARVPFVLVTGSAVPPAPAGVAPIGADDCVTKPFEIDRLLAVLTRVLATATHP
jgi:CheY-like chemotaxis protein